MRSNFITKFHTRGSERVTLYLFLAIWSILAKASAYLVASIGAFRHSFNVKDTGHNYQFLPNWSRSNGTTCFSNCCMHFNFLPAKFCSRARMSWGFVPETALSMTSRQTKRRSSVNESQHDEKLKKKIFDGLIFCSWPRSRNLPFCIKEKNYFYTQTRLDKPILQSGE